ncbi:hypothetical protein DH2020_032961 [Rehmannia glutinosa]|uniref:THH1/TOM1/TOM3 domain-containing protein n=1 Tax=Rehmannia glutinosa TaxID=99300 RepID=A0ABR0VDN6_REHGL
MPLSFPAIDAGVGGMSASWWNEINESVEWQDGIFFTLCAVYALVSSVALIQLIRIELRVPEYGWTTQKVFHLMNFIVNGVRAVVFGFHKQVFLLHTKALTLVLLDLPGLLFFSTYALLVLFWAEIYHQARSLPTDKLRIFYVSINGVIYFIQVSCHSIYTALNELLSSWFLVVFVPLVVNTVEFLSGYCGGQYHEIPQHLLWLVESKCLFPLPPGFTDLRCMLFPKVGWSKIYYFIGYTDKIRDVDIIRSVSGCTSGSMITALQNSLERYLLQVLSLDFVIPLCTNFPLSRLFFMLRRFPIESKGRRKKLHEVGSVTAICFTCFLIRCFVVVLSAFDLDASLDVLDHPVLNLIYYTLVEILPSVLVLYILRKLPPKRVSAQYHPIR